MAKKQSQSDPVIDDVDDEVKQIMGPTPEEAAPAFASFAEDKIATEPKGPPEISQEADSKNISEVAEQINEKLAAKELAIEDAVPKTEENHEHHDDALQDDEFTTAAVADIIAKEGDEILAAEDAKKAAEESPKKSKHGIGYFVSAWWHNKRARMITFAAIAAVLLGLSFYPSTRYAILNTAGVRAGVSLQVIDSKYGLPVKNAEVIVGGQKATTNDTGKVTLSNVKLGKTQLVIAKRSFAPVNQTIIVGWGSNPFNDPFQMSPTGSAYSFTITDWISGKPVSGAEISDGESTALTDDSGRATLTVQPTDKDLELTIKAKDYRTDSLVISSTDKDNKQIKLVAGKPDVFVSKRSGKYDLYKRDVDGKNEVVLVGGTGSEQDPLGLLMSPDGNTAAFVSTREGKRDASGYLLSNLYMVDVSSKTVTKVAGTESAQIQLIDWVGDKLVFVKIASGPSAATAGRQHIVVYDSKQEKQNEITNANYFNDVEVYKDQIYYAPSSGGGPNSAEAKLYRVNTDNSSKTVLIDKEVWATYRNSFNKLQANAADNKWYEQTIGDNKMTVMSGAPASPVHRIYVTSPNNEKAVWVDNRDGKGVLILQDIKTPANPDMVVFSKGGLGYPIRWLSDKHILMRVSNSQETADYIINIEGGEAQKIGDVTNTASTSRWYYYR